MRQSWANTTNRLSQILVNSRKSNGRVLGTSASKVMLDAEDHNQRQYRQRAPRGKLMNGSHKGHNIVASALRSADTRQCKPHVKIIWSEDGQGKISALNVNRAFRARQE